MMIFDSVGAGGGWQRVGVPDWGSLGPDQVDMGQLRARQGSKDQMGVGALG